MLDPKKIAEVDQAFATFLETIPTLWMRLYVRCIEEGFTESQALEILKTYINAVNTPK